MSPSTDLFLGVSSRSPVEAQGPQALSSVCFEMGQIIPDPFHPFYFYTSTAVSTSTSAQTWASKLKLANIGGSWWPRGLMLSRKPSFLGKSSTQPPARWGCSIQNQPHRPLHSPPLQDKAPPAPFKALAQGEDNFLGAGNPDWAHEKLLGEMQKPLNPLHAWCDPRPLVLHPFWGRGVRVPRWGIRRRTGVGTSPPAPPCPSPGPAAGFRGAGADHHSTFEFLICYSSPDPR